MNAIASNSKLKALYETDFNRWLEEIAQLLKQGQLEKLDIDKLR